MNRSCRLFLIPLLFLSLFASAQEQDSSAVQQTVVVRDSSTKKETAYDRLMRDSVTKRPVFKDTTQHWVFNPSQPLSWQVLRQHPYYGFGSKATATQKAPVKSNFNDILFYSLVALLLIFAFLRHAFGKYFNDLFRLFFRTTLKYRQIREQLMQTPLPSLLLNGFFVLSAGMYASFLLIHFQLINREDFWIYFFYSCLGLSAIYLIKFLGLKVIGWIFNMRDAADAYIFVVFVINKVIGVFLLPFLVMLAFMTGYGYTLAVVLSWFGIAGLLLYRFILTYSAVRNQVRFNPFHFFLYLCAFEIAPVLLIYKALLVFFN